MYAIRSYYDGGCAEETVGKRIPPFAEIKIAVDKRGRTLVTLGNQVVQVFVLGRSQWLESQVIDT